ncbi:MAG: GNAT family N-acetyltransferase [Bacteroidales bacterium]
MLTFKEATLNDLETIRQLAYSTFPQTYEKILTQEQSNYMMEMMYSTPNLQKQITEENQIFYLAISNKVPCGYFSIQRGEENKVILQKLYLHPSFQNKGIGKQIMDQVVRAAINHFKECQYLKLYVNRMNKAKEFYLRYGFRITGKRDHEIGSGFYMNDYIMEMPLS